MQTEHERKEAGTITVPTTVSNYNLDCILCICFEGGSDYWIDSVEVVADDYKKGEYVSEVISHDGELKVFHDNRFSMLTKTKLLKGCELYAIRRREWRPDDFDADDTDIILQYALFGDVVYG